MFKRLATSGKKFEEQTRRHINEYADPGLRMLVLAYRVLDEKEYREFIEKFNAAKADVSIDRDEKIEKAADSIERDLLLLGATAVEDKLQKGYAFSFKFFLFKILFVCTILIIDPLPWHGACMCSYV
jgi:phospholipid-translocating ATPase